MLRAAPQITFLARVIEAAARGYGYTAADVPFYNGLLSARLARMAFLHDVSSPFTRLRLSRRA